jgi:tRNA(Ile)-lysidine synthase
MSNVEREVARSLESFGVRSARVVVAVSGGADSMALLAVLHALRNRFELSLHAAHLDHGLRGEDSLADAAFVRQQCAALDVAATIEHCDTRTAAAESHAGIEEAARNLRYRFLTRITQSTGAAWVALAHNADDQVETVLHRLLRGTGLSGLSGMPVTRPLTESITLIRPLLAVTRSEIEGELRQRGLTWREDASNAAFECTRNRIRHRLLPLLRAEFNPQVDAALRNLSLQAREAESIVQTAAARLLEQSLLDAGADEVRIDCSQLVDVPVHLVRALLHRLWQRQACPAGSMTFEHWDALAKLALGAGNPLTLPGGIKAVRRGTLLHLSQQRSAPAD